MNRFLDVAAAENYPEMARIFNGALMTMLRLNDLENLKIENVSKVSNSLKGIQSKTGRPFSIHIFDKIEELIETASSDTFLFDFTNFRTIWERLCVKTNLHNFQFRDLRRSGATWLYKKGGTLKWISNYLGHQSEVMTRRYIGILGEDEMIAGKYMSAIFNTPRNTELKKGEILPEGLKPDIEVANLDIPWLPEHRDR